MGVSPFATSRDLYYDKLGILPIIDEEQNWVAKQVGHLLEGLVAQIFKQKTGYEVWAVKTIFSHPDYPFMQANVDFFYRKPDGTIGGLECKTTNHNARFKGDNDEVPRNYELQWRHYMAVMYIDESAIDCLFANTSNEGVYSFFERDVNFSVVIVNA